MDWGTTKDYMIWVLGAIFAVIQLFTGKNKLYKLFMGILAVSFIWLGIDQINRNGRKDKKAQEQISNLQKGIEGISLAKRTDSLSRVAEGKKDSIFQLRLFAEFKITRDSINNKPISRSDTYNTQIKEVNGPLHIGSKN